MGLTLDMGLYGLCTKSGSGEQSSVGSGAKESAKQGATSGFLASAANAGKVAVEAGAILAKQTASSITDAASERISQTAGGRLAAAIKASQASGESAMPAFDGNSLTGASSTATATDSEVAAFVNPDSGKEV